MKTLLIIYHSFTGGSRAMAQTVAEVGEVALIALNRLSCCFEQQPIPNEPKR